MNAVTVTCMGAGLASSQIWPVTERLVFVPLDLATVGPGYLKVFYGRKLVRDAPSIDINGELPATGEEAVFTHYGLTYQAGAGGERRLVRRCGHLAGLLGLCRTGQRVSWGSKRS